MADKTFRLSIIAEAITKGAQQSLGGLGKVVGGLATGAAALGTAVVGGAALAGGALLKLSIDAAPLEGIENAFYGVAEASGKSGDTMLRSLQKGSQGLITQRDLMQKYNLAASLVSNQFANELPQAMGYLSKVAAGTGEDMGFMLDSLVRGVGRLSPMILDNLGIQVSLSEAYEAFAPTIGKTTSELTKQEQQTALMNQVMEKLAENTAAMPEISGTAATSFGQLTTRIADLKDRVGQALLPILLSLTTVLGDLADRYGPMVIEFSKKVGWALGVLFESIKGGSLDVATLLDVWAEFFGWENIEPVEDIMRAVMAFGDKAREWLSDKIPKAISFLKHAWSTTWPVAQDLIVGFWNAIKPALIWVKDILVRFAQEYLPRLQTAWAKWRGGLNEIVVLYNSQLKPALNELWNALQPLWETLGMGEGVSLDLAGAIGKFTGFMATLYASGIIEGIKGLIHGLTVVVKALVSAYELGVHWGIRVRDVIHSMVGVFNNIRHHIQVVIDIFNNLRNSLSNFQLPWWLNPGSPTPLETGLEGIGKALSKVQGLAKIGVGFGGGLGAVRSSPAGLGGRGAPSITIINQFGPGSVRRDQDIVDISDRITKSLELRGIGPVL